MRKINIVLLAIIALASCTQREIEYVETQSVVIDSVWKKQPISIHDDINPRWNFKTSDGKIHSSINQPKVGDIIIYKKVFLRK